MIKNVPSPSMPAEAHFIAVLRGVAALAANPETDVTWYDAARISSMIRSKLHRQVKVPEPPKEVLGACDTDWL